jgi:hypothetical protein
MARKPRVRVELHAPQGSVARWKEDAGRLDISFSEFVRRACRRYSARLKKRRAAKQRDAA